MDLQITLGITQLLVELDAKLNILFLANFISVQKTQKKKKKKKKEKRLCSYCKQVEILYHDVGISSRNFFGIYWLDIDIDIA